MPMVVLSLRSKLRLLFFGLLSGHLDVLIDDRHVDFARVK